MCGRYKNGKRQEFRCNKAVGGCGKTFVSCARIDKLSGVAGVTCKHCGKTQEPHLAK